MTTEHRLLANVLEPLPPGSIRPTGWLRQQLRIQADGLSGHLDEFWPDIAESGWIGGKAEGWERGPYWLDGLVPLAFLLDDERLKKKVQHWIDYIVTHQHEDGWLGPLHDATYGYPHDPWPTFIALKALVQYHEATGDLRIVPAVERALKRLQQLLAEQPLNMWAQVRSAELVLTIYWLFRLTHEPWLLDFARTVQQQGFDWRALFEDFPYKERQGEWQLQSHGVNHAMALKQHALWYQLTHDQGDFKALDTAITTLDTYHGQANGMFSADEVLAGKNPSQGTELCAVVEYMFSLEQLLAILGQPAFGDRLERITFNALPATFKPDMWAHQYDQQANQVLCTIAEDHVYATNGPESNIFGLEPNFGCCTANMHQGWPKFATHLWMRTADNGLAAVAYAPCTVKTTIEGVPVQIEVTTNYPFEETVQIRVTTERPLSFPLLLRIPAWVQGGTLTSDEQTTEPVEAETFHRVHYSGDVPLTLRLHLPMTLKTQTRYNNAVALERGPLVYALEIKEEWRQVKGTAPHADWEVHPTSPWNYALQIDSEQPEQSYEIAVQAVKEPPFAPETAPIHIKVQARRIPSWGLEQNAAAPPPPGPVISEEPLEDVVLIPYGCTNLRITEFPVL